MPVADGNGVPLLAAFAAGLLSFLSPCVLPLIPSYVSFLTGMTVEEMQVRRGTTLLHALWFVAGFSLIFIALGASASALGVALLASQHWIARVSGVLLILFGLYLVGMVRPAFLMRERRVHLARKPLGYVGSSVAGVAFGAAWTPCIGPDPGRDSHAGGDAGQHRPGHGAARRLCAGARGAVPDHRLRAGSISGLVPAVSALSSAGSSWWRASC